MLGKLGGNLRQDEVRGRLRSRGSTRGNLRAPQQKHRGQSDCLEPCRFSVCDYGAAVRTVVASPLVGCAGAPTSARSLRTRCTSRRPSTSVASRCAPRQGPLPKSSHSVTQHLAPGEAHRSRQSRTRKMRAYAAPAGRANAAAVGAPEPAASLLASLVVAVPTLRSSARASGAWPGYRVASTATLARATGATASSALCATLSTVDASANVRLTALASMDAASVAVLWVPWGQRHWVNRCGVSNSRR